MFKISNQTFYERHLKNLERYCTEGNIVHIIGNENSFLIKNSNVETKYFKPNSPIIDQFKKREFLDTVIFSEYFENSNNLYSTLDELNLILKPNGKLVICVLNYKYSWIVKIFEFLRVKNKSPKLTHINEKYLVNLAETTGFKHVSSYTKQFLPFSLFGIFAFINFLFEILFNRFNFGIYKYIIFKKTNQTSFVNKTKAVLIPAKNEEGNINILFDKLSTLNLDQIIFSVGKSKDKTLEKIEESKKKFSNLNVIVHKQSKSGKANAIWESFEYVDSDLIAILDADLSVDPYELRHFFSIIENDYADFVNGTRLIYPMEKDSMRKINLIGNRIFQFIVSLIINIKISDSLCGTKVFKKNFIKKVYWWQNKYGLHDPFCDFDLLFTAAISGEHVVEYPIHYKSRIYGRTQISRFKDGFKLIIYLIKSYKIFQTSN